MCLQVYNFKQKYPNLDFGDVLTSLAVIVSTQPIDSKTNTAIEFVTAAAQQDNIELLGVFFYQDGVLNASKTLSIPSDEFQAMNRWKALHQQYDVPLYLCITAAEKRGMTDELSGAHSISDTSNINEIFTVAGLGELVELTTKADRLVQL